MRRGSVTYHVANTLALVFCFLLLLLIFAIMLRLIVWVMP